MTKQDVDYAVRQTLEQAFAKEMEQRRMYGVTSEKARGIGEEIPDFIPVADLVHDLARLTEYAGSMTATIAQRFGCAPHGVIAPPVVQNKPVTPNLAEQLEETRDALRGVCAILEQLQIRIG